MNRSFLNITDTFARLAFFLLLISLAGCSSTEKSKEEYLYRVSAQMLYHPRQCSGTLREDALVSTKPSPLGNYIFYIKRGTQNSVSDTAAIKIQTNEKGWFEVMLPRGEFVLLHQFQKDTMSINAFRCEVENYIIDNEEAMWLSYFRPISGLKITDKNIDSLVFKINVECFTPAGIEGVTYIGPLPE